MTARFLFFRAYMDRADGQGVRTPDQKKPQTPYTMRLPDCKGVYVGCSKNSGWAVSLGDGHRPLASRRLAVCTGLGIVMGLENVDLAAALRCARVFVTLFQPRMPPQWATEHLERLERHARGSGGGTQICSAPAESGHDLIGAIEAAGIIGCSAEYVRRIHSDLDGRRIAGRWVFNRKDVQDYAAHRNEARRAC